MSYIAQYSFECLLLLGSEWVRFAVSKSEKVKSCNMTIIPNYTIIASIEVRGGNRSIKAKA